jgi:hypothetical protein
VLSFVSSFNKGSDAEFFDVLLKMIDENKLDATRVFIVDEEKCRTTKSK